MTLISVYFSCFSTVRSRKKNKQTSSRQKSSKSKSKKQSSSSQSSKQRAGPNSPADIDDLVRNLSRGPRLTLCPFFREPVSAEEAEDYLDIISQPMDFQTMLGKFSQGSYRHAQDFLEDIKLVFSNAEEYNQVLFVVFCRLFALKIFCLAPF
uniref:Bromo domain-containing protein n=1 Tax=Seriola lalandi dorsalis TaxID=1841481 RepID=A0A3B4WIU9_SERLL